MRKKFSFVGMLLTLAALSLSPAYGEPTVSVRPFLMVGEIRGDVTTQGVTSDFSQGFGNGFEKANGAVGLDVDVHGDSFGSLSQLWFTSLGDTGTTPDLPAIDAAEQTLDATFFTQTVGVSVYRSGRNFIDLTAGGRLASVGNTLTVRTGGLEVERDDDRIWVDPVVGFNSALYAAESVVFRLGGDVGGFTAASNLTWQGWASVGVRVGKKAGLHAGYRAIAHDYEDGDFTYDAVMRGPTLGLDFGF